MSKERFKEIESYGFTIVAKDFERPRISFEFRMIFDLNIKAVDKAILSINPDRTVCETIKMIAEKYGNEFEIAFANGGDQNNNIIPERSICEEMNVGLLDGPGDKIQISSWLLNK